MDDTHVFEIGHPMIIVEHVGRFCYRLNGSIIDFFKIRHYPIKMGAQIFKFLQALFNTFLVFIFHGLLELTILKIIP